MIFILNLIVYKGQNKYIARIIINKSNMKKFNISILSAIIILIISVATFSKIKVLKEENARLKANQEILLTENKAIMSDNRKYVVSDSLNAVRTSQLELTLKEYKKYKSKDLELIKQLKSRKSDLQRVINSQSETISNLSAKLKDSIPADSADTLKCFNYKSKWIDVDGCISLNCDSINLQIKNRESLRVIEMVVRKRFLGFLWKTNKVKSKHVNVLSENPNTKIVNCEYISIKR